MTSACRPTHHPPAARARRERSGRALRSATGGSYSVCCVLCALTPVNSSSSLCLRGTARATYVFQIWLVSQGWDPDKSPAVPALSASALDHNVSRACRAHLPWSNGLEAPEELRKSSHRRDAIIHVHTYLPLSSAFSSRLRQPTADESLPFAWVPVSSLSPRCIPPPHPFHVSSKQALAGQLLGGRSGRRRRAARL